MHGAKRLVALAVLAALIVVLGALRPAGHTPPAEATFTAPGGIAALPSAAPAVPGLNNQAVPAIIGTGQPGIVAVFCSGPLVPLAGGTCSDLDDDGNRSITFEIERLYPTDGSPPALTFDATGTSELVVADNGGADEDSALGVVTVRVNAAAATQGGTQGVNEIVEVSATDEAGERRSVQIFVVDTILAAGPTGPLSTASQEQPLFIAYHCDVTGRAPLAEGSVAWAIDPDADGSQGLDDMYDGYYGQAYDNIGPGNGYGSNSSSTSIHPVTGLPDLDLPDVWCGGDTPGSLFDDYVTFQTDLGLFSIEPVAQSLKSGAALLAASEIAPGVILGYFFPPVIDASCGEGKSVNVFDIDALTVWGSWLLGGFPDPNVGSWGFVGGCDADGWRNSVVTMMLLGNGEEGTATITAQQGGGVSPQRTINAAFVGQPGLSLFLTAPATMGLEGGEFIPVLVDDKFRPIGDETVSCTLDPVQSGLIIVPQTGTTGTVTGALPGQVVMRIVPTGAAVVEGGTIAVICKVDRYPSVKAVAVVTLVSYETESVDLVPGCNPVSLTWPDATPIETVAGAVAPADALDAIWKFDPETDMWQGHSPAAPEASDLTSVNMLDAVFVCMNATGSISRPVV